MTKIRVEKKHGVFVPSLPQDSDFFESIPQGEIFEFDFVKKRNAKFHKKYFAMLNVVLQHTEKWENVEQLRAAVLLNIGHFDMIWEPINKMMIPKVGSINWAQMDEVKFNRIFQDSLTVIMKYYLPDWDKATFNQALNEILDFA